jgi:hypothetical protein
LKPINRKKRSYQSSNSASSTQREINISDKRKILIKRRRVPKKSSREREILKEEARLLKEGRALRAREVEDERIKQKANPKNPKKKIRRVAPPILWIT